MRVFLPAFALLFPFAPAHAQETADIATTPIIEQTSKRLTGAKIFSRMSGSPDVLIIGDSMAGLWKSFQDRQFAGLNVVNMGLGGEKTQELRWRLAEIPPKVKPANVVLLIGTNNLRTDVPASGIVRGISAVVDDLRSLWPDTKLYVFGILPRGPEFLFRETDRRVINQAIADRLGATFVPVDEAELTCRRQTSNPCEHYHKDSLHLTGSGYDILRQSLVKAGL